MTTTVHSFGPASLLLLGGVLMTQTCHAEWEPHAVLQMEGETVAAELPAEQQIVTEIWNRVVAVPYIVYMPEKDRVLMLVGCDYPHQAMTLYSDDHGATWSEPRYVHTDAEGNSDVGMGVSLTYLGGGKVVFSSGRRWFSSDYGESWEGREPIPPASNGKSWYQWDPYLVDRDPATGEVTGLT